MAFNLDRRGLLAMIGTSAAVTAMPAWAAAAPFFKRIGKPVGVQLYALGEAAQKDLAGTLTQLAAMGYGDFELPGLYGRSPKDVRADADKAGVRYGCMHLGLPGLVPPGGLSLISSPQEIADAAGTLGISKIVLPFPLLPADFRMPTDGNPLPALIAAVKAGGLDMWKRLGGLLNERAAALRPHGVDLGYHNHNMDFMPQGGTTGYAVLLKELDPGLVFLELDLGWVAAAGLDPVAQLRALKGRVKMVHLKDIKATTKANYALQQDPAEVGLGTLNWRTLLPACQEVGIEHYYVEQEAPFTRDRFESMQLSYNFLSTFKG